MSKEITMKAICVSLLCALLGLVAAATASTSDVKLIANESVTASSVSLSDVQEAFLLTSPTLGSGGRIVPVLETSGPAYEVFLKEYVKKTDSALQTYYRSLVFTGKGSLPKMFNSDDEVVAYVAKTKGAVGYVSAAAAAPGTKTIHVK